MARTTRERGLDTLLLRGGQLGEATLVRRRILGAVGGRPDDPPATLEPRLATRTSPLVVLVDDADRLPAGVLPDLVALAGAYECLRLVATCTGVAPPPELAGAEQVPGRLLSLLGPSSAEATDASAPDATAPERRAQTLTGGWPLPTVRIATALRRRQRGLGLNHAITAIDSALQPSVLGAELHHAALRFAIPEAVDAALADALLGREPQRTTPVRVLLTRLIDCGLLHEHRSRTGRVQWRFAPLVLRALRDQLAHVPQTERQAAHRAVAGVAVERGDVASAAHHARSAHDWGLLRLAWERGQLSFLGGDASAALDSVASLPDAALRQAPELMLPRTIAQGLLGAEEDREHVTTLRRAGDVGEWLLRRSSSVPGPLRTEAALAATIGRLRAGRVADATALARHLTEDLASAVPTSDPDAGHRRSLVLVERALCETVHDGPEKAVGFLEDAFREGREAARTFPAELAAATAALHEVFLGRSTNAELWLSRYESLRGGHWASWHAEAPALAARGQRAMDRLDVDGAARVIDAVGYGSSSLDMWPFATWLATRHALATTTTVIMLQRLEELAERHATHLQHGGFAAALLERCRTDVLLALGEVDLAGQLVAESTVGRGRHLHVPQARLALMTGDPVTAARVAGAAWSRTSRVRDRIELLLLHAVAVDGEASAGSAARALDLARASGVVEPYLGFELDVRIDRLLPSEIGADALPAMLRTTPSVYPASAERVHLSPRELEVLRALARFETLGTAARHLNVSVNTVKKQAVSAYAKLGVHDRGAALLRARGLGLVG